MPDESMGLREETGAEPLPAPRMSESVSRFLPGGVAGADAYETGGGTDVAPPRL